MKHCLSPFLFFLFLGCAALAGLSQAPLPCQQANYPPIQINEGQSQPQYECSGTEASVYIRLAGGLPAIDSGRSTYRVQLRTNEAIQSQWVASNGSISNTVIHLEDGDRWQLIVWDSSYCDTAYWGYPEAFHFQAVKARIKLSTQPPFCIGQRLGLDAQASSGRHLRYEWSPVALLDSRADRPKASIRLRQDCRIQLRVSDDWGCSDTSSRFLHSLFPQHSAFSPNGDGINDTWWLPCVETLQAKVQVWDAQGKRLFEQSNYQNDWDGRVKGKAIAAGSYRFVLSWPLPYGREGRLEGLLFIHR